MFNNEPSARQCFITKPKRVWKVFNLRDNSQLEFQIMTNRKLSTNTWLTSQPDYVTGFHVWRSWFGAWAWRRSGNSWNDKNLVIRRVWVKGDVFGVGREGFWRGFRVNKMFIPDDNDPQQP